MRIVCCDCKHEYDVVLFKAEGVSVPIIECPQCGLQHAMEFTPLRKELKTAADLLRRAAEKETVNYKFIELMKMKSIQVDYAQKEIQTHL